MVVPTTLFYKISQKGAGASVDSAITQLQPLPERDRKPSMVAAFSRNITVMTASPVPRSVPCCECVRAGSRNSA